MRENVSWPTNFGKQSFHQNEMAFKKQHCLREFNLLMKLMNLQEIILFLQLIAITDFKIHSFIYSFNKYLFTA